MKIDDGTGSGKQVKVDTKNRLRTHSTTEPEPMFATIEGDGYNLNTGLISITADATILYLKNNEDRDFEIEAIAVGAFEGITHSDDPYITIIRNPTGGDLISDATAISMNQNRNFGSNKVLTVDVFKGKVGGTVTGGNDIAILQVSPGTRSFFSINWILQKGSSIGIKLTANVSSGSANYYIAIIGHLAGEE